MIQCIVLLLCCLAQIPGMLNGNCVSIFVCGFCFSAFLTVLIEEVRE